jgi:protein TIF31
MAINPGEEAKMQMFIWNNIFFSLGFDVKDHYKDLGGDAAAFVAPRNDLQGVKVSSDLSCRKLTFCESRSLPYFSSFCH